jgi:hypothetical protein
MITGAAANHHLRVLKQAELARRHPQASMKAAIRAVAAAAKSSREGKATAAAAAAAALAVAARLQEALVDAVLDSPAALPATKAALLSCGYNTASDAGVSDIVGAVATLSDLAEIGKVLDSVSAAVTEARSNNRPAAQAPVLAGAEDGAGPSQSADPKGMWGRSRRSASPTPGPPAAAHQTRHDGPPAPTQELPPQSHAKPPRHPGAPAASPAAPAPTPARCRVAASPAAAEGDAAGGSDSEQGASGRKRKAPQRWPGDPLSPRGDAGGSGAGDTEGAAAEGSKAVVQREEEEEEL